MKKVNLQNLIDYSKMMNEPDPLYGVELPDPLDAEKCKSAILMRCGLLEPVYNDPRVFREMIYTWFHIRDWNFKHLIAIIQAEYSPIENTDRYSEHTVTNSGSDSRKYGGSDETKRIASDTVNGSSEESTSRTESGRDSRTRTPNLQSLTIDEISAENANDYQPDSQHRTSDSGSETTAGTSDGEESERRNGSRAETGSHSSTETNSYGKTETGSRNGKETYTEHTHGNIGVTSNVQLINEETELLRRFNVYDWIAERVEETFFIMVY